MEANKKKVYVEGRACCCGTVERVGDDKEKAFASGKEQEQKFGHLDNLTEEGIREKFEDYIKDSADSDGGITEMEVTE